jgi:galactokinase
VQFRVFNTHTRHALVDGLYAQRHRECRQAAERLGVRVLADVTPAALDRHEHRLTAVQRARARHVVFEIARVQAAAKAMRAGDARSLGRLLLQSHASSRDLFENSTAELDFLVEKLTALPGVLGARLTGGGFGGAVMALTDSSFSPDAAARLQREYAARLGGRLESMALAAGGGATPVNPGAKA